jgi:hypothetical protein
VVEQRVSIVHETEEDNQRPFYPSERSDMVGLGPLFLLREGDYDGLFLSCIKSVQHTSSGEIPRRLGKVIG